MLTIKCLWDITFIIFEILPISLIMKMICILISYKKNDWISEHFQFKKGDPCSLKLTNKIISVLFVHFIKTSKYLYLNWKLGSLEIQNEGGKRMIFEFYISTKLNLNFWNWEKFHARIGKFVLLGLLHIILL